MLQRSDDPRPVIRPERKGALDGAVKPGGQVLIEGGIPNIDLDSVQYERTPEPIEPSPAQPGAVFLKTWEELTETDSGYLLRHDGKLYAAREIDADAVVNAVFSSPPLKTDGIYAPGTK